MTCEICGSLNYLVIHHKDGNHQNDTKDNRQTLCNYCHGKEHPENEQIGIIDTTSEIAPHRLGHRLNYADELVNGQKTPPY